MLRRGPLFSGSVPSVMPGSAKREDDSNLDAQVEDYEFVSISEVVWLVLGIWVSLAIVFVFACVPAMLIIGRWEPVLVTLSLVVGAICTVGVVVVAIGDCLAWARQGSSAYA